MADWRKGSKVTGELKMLEGLYCPRAENHQMTGFLGKAWWTIPFTKAMRRCPEGAPTSLGDSLVVPSEGGAGRDPATELGSNGNRGIWEQEGQQEALTRQK